MRIYYATMIWYMQINKYDTPHEQNEDTKNHMIIQRDAQKHVTEFNIHL